MESVGPVKVSGKKSEARGCRGRKPFKLLYLYAPIMALALIALSAIYGYAEKKIPVITIHAKRYKFAPAEITLTIEKPTRLVFVADDVAHGISIDGFFSDLDIIPGKPKTVVITPHRTGDFVGECSRYCGHGHERMTFVIHVAE